MYEPGWTSLLTPLLAITLAITTRQVYLALMGGIWLGYSLLAGGNVLSGLAASIDVIVAVFASGSDAKVIIFTLVIGALITTTEASGGVRGFIAWLESRRRADNGKRAQWLAFAIGVLIFIESNITVLVLSMPQGLWITGDGNVAHGSGSTSVLWAVLAALTTCWLLLIGQRAMSVEQLTRLFLRGAGDLLPLALILLLALALGGVARELGAGAWVAGLVPTDMGAALMLQAVFFCAAFIAFSVGSSWGTFAIMIPTAIPASVALGLPAAPFLAAVLSGRFFGDHASPISDTHRSLIPGLGLRSCRARAHATAVRAACRGGGDVRLCPDGHHAISRSI